MHTVVYPNTLYLFRNVLWVEEEFVRAAPGCAKEKNHQDSGQTRGFTHERYELSYLWFLLLLLNAEYYSVGGGGAIVKQVGCLICTCPTQVRYPASQMAPSSTARNVTQKSKKNITHMVLEYYEYVFM